MGVEAGRHQHQIGVEDARGGQHDVLDEAAEEVLASAGGHRQVDRVALPRSRAGVRQRPGARIERVLVEAHEEHLRRLVEDRVGAVAVMDVPVEHQHPLGAERVERMSRGDRHGGQQAEAHGAVVLGVMARAGAEPRTRPAPRLPAERRPARRLRPAARSAASQDPSDVGVSRSKAPARALVSRTASTYSCGWTAISCSGVARGASRRSYPSQSCRCSSASTACMRATRSGWPGPVSCSSDDGWLKKTGTRRRYGTGVDRSERGRRRRGRGRGGPVRSPDRCRAGSAGGAGEPLAAGADRLVLGPGWNRGRAGRGRLARSSTTPTPSLPGATRHGRARWRCCAPSRPGACAIWSGWA